MIKCVNCGYEIEEGCDVCYFCGNSPIEKTDAENIKVYENVLIEAQERANARMKAQRRKQELDNARMEAQRQQQELESAKMEEQRRREELDNARIEEERRQQLELEHQQIYHGCIVSTTSNLVGYEITDYCGVVFGTDIYLVGGLIGGGLVNQEKLYGKAFKTAMRNMVIRAKSDYDADAIVGVAANITSPGSVNNMIIVMTGTAVKIKKCE